ncbi:MAG TPA: aminotransferase class V-fold PLP-dependent enzyme, partial [Vicinamibacteria bacterium]|nr:aminotransferase class V-fold PLP-dependent enzyme [Vicinamibacteria bacterium]
GEARRALAAFVQADPADLAFVSNATSGVNAVLRSLPLRAGDELLTTDHAYAACRKAMEYVAGRQGARVVVAEVPFPLGGEDEVVEAVLGAVTPRTRLAVLDHVTSPTALVFPIQRLARELAARAVDVLVDGAHAPGMVPLDLARWAPAYYTGNAHKWMCAPKGAAFLYVRRDRQAHVHPLVISHGYRPGREEASFREEFDWPGTDDPTAFLSVAESIRFLGSVLPGGWPELTARNHSLALHGRALVCEALGVDPPCPDGMLGSMASIPLPAAAPASAVEALDADGLAAWFRARGTEAWFTSWPCAGGKLVRLSAQLYNHAGQYALLADLLLQALRGR